jgi:hypothetical protein
MIMAWGWEIVGGRVNYVGSREEVIYITSRTRK